MRLGWIEVLKKAYGETVYTGMAQTVLSGRHDLERINVGLDHFNKFLYPMILYRLFRVSGKKEIWIRGFDSILMMPFDGAEGKNIALIFHVDQSFQPIYFQPLWSMLENVFYRHLKKADLIVTISKYWQNHFLERGYPRVDLIYNAFDADRFCFEPDEVEEFKKRFRLEGKPIVYLGNCQRIKGVVEAYERLKDMEVHLVTSGRREVDLPTLNLNLSYREYLLLLRSSSVVIALSKFKEGWNRTAHEAMLCKTPVIGSGLGGMRELLEGGGQIVCEDVGDLRERVRYVLGHPERGEAGYRFAKQFTVKRFEEQWLNLVKRVHEEK